MGVFGKCWGYAEVSVGTGAKFGESMGKWARGWSLAARLPEADRFLRDWKKRFQYYDRKENRKHSKIYRENVWKRLYYIFQIWTWI